MVNRLEGKSVIGLKQTTKCIKNGEGKILYVAKDADSKLMNPIIKSANVKALEVIYIDTMKELGKLCGIDVGAAVALILE
ncbi:ribosomal L7Ae/L30e/S12e/Gadd45 family protein [Clostridium aestuarii]|uniref:Ribosomal L7Ae/L30e/S12e/Gadd45 family protein n=1 Tax=Clostridium aestuarii TaxID=338193 RepID=A0ABT4CWZ7_9CLOT|nr:ribosomal L7Ae/L30e/S12e/Gadd45 family protein [Clostridium aestuarii]MCY6483504.1 ribosomal L7Ae/L30e/S12e/Gadd45 family protein [Clostridium aestuarii]